MDQSLFPNANLHSQAKFHGHGTLEVFPENSDFGVLLTGGRRGERDPSSSQLFPSQHFFFQTKVRVTR